MKTYKEPGKARKLCPECKAYVHARSLECVCGYIFGKRTTPEKKQEYKDGPSRGRKLCPQCKKYVGAKTKVCLCGNEDFKKTAVKVSANKLYTEEIKIKTEIPGAMNYVGKLILVPSGQCPVELENIDKESVYNWCDTIFNKGLRNNCTYSEGALKYWARIEFNKPEANDLIHEWAIKYGYEKNLYQSNENEPESNSSSGGTSEALLVLNS